MQDRQAAPRIEDCFRPAHYVLTRINVRLRDGQPFDPVRWNARLTLFRDGLCASMAQQSAPPTGWLLFVSDDTPPEHLGALGDGLPDYATIVPVAGVFGADAVQVALAQAWPGKGVLVTTRVDSDDRLMPDFLARIRGHALRQMPFALNFPFGLQSGAAGCYLRSDFANPFLSLFEEPDGTPPMTVFHDWHTRMPDHVRVVQDPCRPIWVQGLHDGNLANKVSGLTLSLQGARLQQPPPPDWAEIARHIRPRRRQDLLFPAATLAKLALFVTQNRISRPLARLRGRA